MKQLTKSILMAILIVNVLSCNNDEITIENCTLATITNYDGDDGAEAMQVTYTNGKITQLLGNTLKYQYEYDNIGRITTKHYIEIGNGPNDILKVEYSYNNDNTINQEKFYILNNGTYELYSKLTFSYLNGKISTAILNNYDNNIESYELTFN